MRTFSLFPLIYNILYRKHPAAFIGRVSLIYVLILLSFVCLLSSFYCFCEERNNLEEVAYNAVVSNLEDRSGLVLVDSNDDFGVFHTGEMLNCTGDTASDI